jgi:hypothetical protein
MSDEETKENYNFNDHVNDKDYDSLQSESDSEIESNNLQNITE